MSYNLVDPTTGDLTRVAGGILYAETPVGTVLSFSGTAIPAGYLLCDGRAVSRITYAALFAVIGTTFGAGDGSTTFNLPNLIDRFIEGTESSVGQTLNAGLPNITAKMNKMMTDSGGEFSGAVYVTEKPKARGWAAADFDEVRNLTFDASRSSAVYGKSNTVQPPAVKMLYIIKAISTALPFDYLEYVRNQNLLSDLENITISTNSSNPSIMEYDGFLMCYNSTSGNIYINGFGFPLGQEQPSGVYNIENTNTIPVKKGDSVYTSVTPYVSRARFYKQRDYGGR